MSAYRRAAVTLHGLHEDDRAAILAGFSDADRAALVQCLDELHALGFASAVLPQQDAMPPAVPAGQPGHAVERIRQAGAAQIFAVLEHEPVSLVAQVMAIEHWPWAPAVLHMFASDRRERIRAALPQPAAPAPARRQFLLDSVVRQLPSVPAVPAPLLERLRAARHSLSPLIRSLSPWKR